MLQNYWWPKGGRLVLRKHLRKHASIRLAISNTATIAGENKFGTKYVYAVCSQATTEDSPHQFLTYYISHRLGSLNSFETITEQTIPKLSFTWVPTFAEDRFLILIRLSINLFETNKVYQNQHWYKY